VIASLRYLLPYFSIIVPMGLVNLVGSMQCIASAEAAGDAYDVQSSLAVNGATTLVAACFGSPYPTTIYIGHPGWKMIGARAGYSTLNAIFVTLVLLTGSLSVVARAIPIEAGMAILIWIGITMGTQAFGAVPKRHIPAVIVGLFPAIAGYCALVAKNVLGGAGVGTPANPFRRELIDRMLTGRNFYAEGMFALDQGYFFACLIFAAATVAIIEQQFRRAAVWFLAGAALASVGLIHTFGFVTGDIVGVLAPGWKWVWGYLAMAFTMLVFPRFMVRTRVEPVI
jgi:AGZA family xanthine/uracil permease-like MFS transporter